MTPEPIPVAVAVASAPALTEAPTPEGGSEATLAVADAGPQLDQKTRAKLDRILRNVVSKKGVVGLQAAVRLPTGETWLGSAGRAETSPDRPIRDDTQFAIASVTKTFMAALILQLAEEGKVDLDVPFGRYFADAPRSKKVTLRQLLGHRSGIYNFWEHPRYGDITDAWYQRPDATGLLARDHVWTYDEMMDLLKAGYFKPGKGYHYSNTNYLILRRVAEEVTGQPIHKLLRQRFFEPLGLDDTVYQPAQLPRPDAAHGHWDTGSSYMDHTRDSRVIPLLAAITIADGAGAIASSARDLATWASALYGGEVLSAESLAEMTTFQLPGGYGLGAYPLVYAGHRGIGHRGGIRGFESSMFYFPDSGVSVVLLSNQGNWDTYPPMERLVKAVLGKR